MILAGEQIEMEMPSEQEASLLAQELQKEGISVSKSK